MDRPCSHCRVLTDAEFLEDRGDLGMGCEALCDECEQAIEAEAAEEERERDWYREDSMDRQEGWR